MPEETKKLAYSTLTYNQMAGMVESIWNEVKRRNPLFVNAYKLPFLSVVEGLKHLHRMKQKRKNYDEV